MVEVADSATASAGAPRVLPLTLLDEGLLHLQNARAEWNVQFELSAAHRIDEPRLRRAVLAACLRHPLTRARLASWRGWESSYRWQILDDCDVDPLRVVDCADEPALERVRSELYDPAVPLDLTPGFRVVLARRPAGDHVLLCTSHLVADGVGAVRLMQSITRAYRGAADPGDPLPLDEARDLASFLCPERGTAGRAWWREARRRIAAGLGTPTRIAVDTGADGHRDGCGFVRRIVDIGADTAPGLVRRAPGTTINDVLLAALHLTVQSWNRSRRGRNGRIGVMMPVNVRPADRFWEVVSNITSMVPVSTAAADRTDLATATAAVARQTAPVRRRDRAVGLYELLDLTRSTPLVLKRAAPRLLPLVGDRFVDSAMLSNLGRLPDPPTFDGPGGPAPELWFSPPCDPACSVAIGVATVGERLTLVTRYRRDQFDAAAAAEFTDQVIAWFAPQARAADRGHRGHRPPRISHPVVSVLTHPTRRLDPRLIGRRPVSLPAA